MQTGELEFLRQHPGGFDRDFFTAILPTLILEFVQHRGLAPTDVDVIVRLRNGETFLASASRSGLTYVAFFTEDDQMRFVPMNEVAEVIIRRRPELAPERNVGFTATQLEADAESQLSNTARP